MKLLISLLDCLGKLIDSMFEVRNLSVLDRTNAALETGGGTTRAAVATKVVECPLRGFMFLVSSVLLSSRGKF